MLPNQAINQAKHATNGLSAQKRRLNTHAHIHKLWFKSQALNIQHSSTLEKRFHGQLACNMSSKKNAIK